MKQGVTFLRMFVIFGFIISPVWGEINRYTVTGDDPGAIENALQHVGGKKHKSYKHFPGVAAYLSPGQAKQVEKELGFKNKKDIEKFGVDKFVALCKERV